MDVKTEIDALRKEYSEINEAQKEACKDRPNLVALAERDRAYVMRVYDMLERALGGR